MQLTLNTAAVHWCMVAANLCAVRILLGELEWHKAAVSCFGTAAQQNKADSLP